MRHIPAIAVCVLAAFSGCRTTDGDLLTPPPFGDSNADGFWRAAQPGETDLPYHVLREYMRLCERTGACSQLVVHRGKIVSEWYSERYEEPLGAMSSR